jgi:hypothetical protein
MITIDRKFETREWIKYVLDCCMHMEIKTGFIGRSGRVRGAVCSPHTHTHTHTCNLSVCIPSSANDGSRARSGGGGGGGGGSPRDSVLELHCAPRHSGTVVARHGLPGARCRICRTGSRCGIPTLKWTVDRDVQARGPTRRYQARLLECWLVRFMHMHFSTAWSTERTNACAHRSPGQSLTMLARRLIVSLK